MYSPRTLVFLLMGISLTLGGCGLGRKEAATETDNLVCLSRADLRLVGAAMNRNTRAIEAALREGADANSSIEGLAPPIVIAALSDNLEAVKLLLDKGANVNASDGEGYTPLICASLGNNGDIVHLLLERGADVNASAHPTINGQRIRLTALMIAKSRGHEKIAKSLTEAGAKE